MFQSYLGQLIGTLTAVTRSMMIVVSQEQISFILNSEKLWATLENERKG